MIQQQIDPSLYYEDIHNGIVYKVGTGGDDNNIYEECSEHLRNGGLVSFPTETVYGLGANALDEKAVYSIFKAKKRPLTDPVIVHVLDVEQAKKYITIEENSLHMRLYEHLAASFWPGPLTIVSKSNEKVIPDCVTASTGFVGIRVPAHPIVRKLLEHCKLPISAPSANRFGHISPTRASHVMEDLGLYRKDEIDNENVFRILVLEEADSTGGGIKSECSVGIESTVAKISELEDKTSLKLEVLRRGGISLEQLKKSVQEFITVEETIRGTTPNICVEARHQTYSVKMNDNTAQIAPGQLITHYAPYVPAFILDSNHQLQTGTTESCDESEKEKTTLVPIEDSILVDFGGKLNHLNSHCMHYIDLSPSSDINVARNKVFQVLRDCEKIENAKAIILPNLLNVDIEHADSLFDRLFRAASGTFASIIFKEEKYSLVLPCK